MLRQVNVLQVALEAVAKGTAALVGFVDVKAYDVTINPAAVYESRRGGGKYLGNNDAGVVGLQEGVCTFSCELRGNGTTAMDAGVAVLLQGCGFTETVNTYALTSAPASMNTLTIHAYEDGVRKVLFGAMGTWKSRVTEAKAVMLDFEFKGIYSAVTDVPVPAFAPGTNPPPTLAGATFSITAARAISAFSIDLQNEVYVRPDPNTATGLSYAVIVNRDILLSCDLEAALVATYAMDAAWRAGTEAVVSIVFGSGAGKQITIAIPKFQYREIPEGERNGIITYDVVGQCNKSSGDDEISIVVTSA